MADTDAEYPGVNANPPPIAVSETTAVYSIPFRFTIEQFDGMIQQGMFSNLLGHRSPSSGRYHSVVTVDEYQPTSPQTIPSASLKVADLFRT